MNKEGLGKELLDFGYTGSIDDLIKYSGSYEALSWYWKSHLKKLLQRSGNYYGGAFIRFKIREDSRIEYSKFLKRNRKYKRINQMDINKEKISAMKKQAYVNGLDKWFSDYEKHTDKDQLSDDLKSFIETSGYFDYLTDSHKADLINLESPVFLNNTNRQLFYCYYKTLHACC
jgi:hypothetical protein